MPITNHVWGGTSITGHTSTEYFRLACLLTGLRLEARTGGTMKITRGPTCLARIKREFKFKGNRDSVLQQFEAYVAAYKTQVEFVTEKTDEKLNLPSGLQTVVYRDYMIRTGPIRKDYWMTRDSHVIINSVPSLELAKQTVDALLDPTP